MRVLHKVREGDSLEKIAISYGCSVEEIAKINDFSSYDISHLDLIEIPKNKSDFVVIKNQNKEFLLEVDKNIINDLKKLLNEKVIVASSSQTKGVYEEGDKIIFKNSAGKTYITKPLDTLKTIAKQFGVSEQYIIKNNNLKTYKLFIGQRIVI